MDGIYCNNCGAKLDEAPTLLPEQRPPCPNCGSLARRFQQTVGSNFFRLPGEQPITIVRTGPDLRAEAQTATGTGTAYDAKVRVTESEPPTASGAAMASARVTGQSSGFGRITDHLGVVRRFLRWTQLTEKPGAVWFAEVLDESGEVIDSGAGDNQDDALLAIIDSLRPPDPA